MKAAVADAVLAVFTSERPEEHVPALRRFTPAEWERSMFWLDASGLALYFLDALHSHNMADVVPAPVLRRLEQNARDNRARTETLRAELTRVNSALADAGVQFAALKGFTLSPHYCPNLALRLQLDLDYLVSRGSIPAIAAAVKALGYQVVSDLPFEVRFVTNPGAVRKHADLYKPPVSKMLEFHFSLFDRPEVAFDLPDDVLANARPARLGSDLVTVLAPEDLFLHQLFHIFQDVLMFSVRLSSLLELANGLRARQHTPEFWESVRRRCCGWDPRLGAMGGLVLALAHETFRCDVPGPLRAWTLEQCPKSVLLWTKHYGHRWALQAFPGSKLSLLVTRELMDRNSWRAYAWRSVLPVTRPAGAGALGTKVITRQRNSRHIMRRVAFHIREALRVAAEWPRWTWKLRGLTSD